MNKNAGVNFFNDNLHIIDCHIAEAQASKDAGDAAMIQNRLNAASFYYKRVYMLLAEYLPTGSEIAPWLVHLQSPKKSDQAFFVDILKHNQTRFSKSFLSRSETPNVTDNHSRSFSSGSRYALNHDNCMDTESEGSGRPNGSEWFTQTKRSRQQKVYRLLSFAMCGLVLVNLKLGRYAEGVAVATFLLEPSPFLQDNSKVLLRRAQCLLKLGDCAAVEKDLNELEIQGFKHPSITTLREEIVQLNTHSHESQVDNVPKYVSSASPLLC
ncbi:unnamed protein product [Phytomonas sp. Hart1]|nr:unnamed protein product [Phytomonas sp. Hart1]|eukprot:CCW66631.1 unnamed protein product [Phytomonas sp. isolate Hart1]